MKWPRHSVYREAVVCMVPTHVMSTHSTSRVVYQGIATHDTPIVCISLEHNQITATELLVQQRLVLHGQFAEEPLETSQSYTH